MYNASNIEVLKLRKKTLITDFERKKEQNVTHNKLIKDKKHLEELILYISGEKTHYDIKVNEAIFKNDDTVKLSRDYKKITDALNVLNNTLQDEYIKLSLIT